MTVDFNRWMHGDPTSDDDGVATIVEFRLCADHRCGAQVQLSGPTPEAVEQEFQNEGWRAGFCPSHQHLAGRA